MKNDLLQRLPQLLPLVSQWAEQQESIIIRDGIALPDIALADAKNIGVEFPEKIRLLQVDAIPSPEHSDLQQAAIATQLITKNTAGLTLRYGIFIRHDCWNDRRLIAHECAHTAQYEHMGSIETFIQQYLRECIEIGYPAAPMEQEAIRAEKLIKG